MYSQYKIISIFIEKIVIKVICHKFFVIFFSDSSEIESSKHSHSIKKRQSFDGTKRVVCYFANWSVYRSGTAKFTPQNINPYLCTHLIYAFGGLGKDDTIQPFDKYQDLEKGK